MILLAAGLWGTGGLFIRAAALPAEILSFFRMVVPAALLGIVAATGRISFSRAGLRLRIVASVINAGRMYFFFLAFSYTSVATATVTLYSWPIFAAILGRLLLGERIGRVRATLFAVAFMGIPLLYAGGLESVGQRDAIGISVMLISAALHALVVIMLKIAGPGSSRFESTFFQNVVGAVVFGMLFLSRGVLPEPQQIAIGLSLGLVVGLGAFTLFFVGMHQLSAGSAALLTYFEVVVATALGTLVLGEPLSWTTAVGGVLIVGSLVGAQWYVIRTGR